MYISFNVHIDINHTGAIFPTKCSGKKTSQVCASISQNDMMMATFTNDHFLWFFIGCQYYSMLNIGRHISWMMFLNVLWPEATNSFRMLSSVHLDKHLNMCTFFGKGKGRARKVTQHVSHNIPTNTKLFVSVCIIHCIAKFPMTNSHHINKFKLVWVCLFVVLCVCFGSVT